ncbi:MULTISPECIES: hypothetical protein [Enterobacteriaceae]|uniref:hypothetical protein n=1 Tax=Enterobacteriaceae TaxID=543 RepID=UPI001F0A92A7|nr:MULTISPECIES: hypothetical protein [Enterobacteriaceae]
MVDYQFSDVICLAYDRSSPEQSHPAANMVVDLVFANAGVLIKVRVVETQHFLEHDLCVAGFSFYRWKRLVSPGLWSVDCINGRFRLNRITQVGKTIHYPWRLHYHPLFMSPIEHKSHAVKAVSK